MAAKLDYPACFTDAEWKRLEKEKVKLRNTGVGATLRELQQKVEAMNKVITQGKKAQPAINGAIAAAKKASAAVTKAGGKIKTSRPDKKSVLNNLVWQLDRYVHELEVFNPEDHRGLDSALTKTNGNIKWLGDQKATEA